MVSLVDRYQHSSLDDRFDADAWFPHVWCLAWCTDRIDPGDIVQVFFDNEEAMIEILQ